VGALHRFIATRVSRRLFVLFVLAAFLPLALIAWLSLTQVNQLLLQQGEQRLAATAKTYGMATFERLLVAGDIAVAAAFHPGMPADARVARTFEALTLIDGAKSVSLTGPVLAPAISPESRERLEAGKPVVLIVGEARAPRVLLAQALPPPSTAIVVGELKGEHLWGPADELPAMTDFCVYQEGTWLWLYCSTPMDSSMVEALNKPFASTLGAETWSRNGERFRARAWTQFMRAAFGTPDWMVIASQPEAYQLSRAVEFSRLYVPVIALALLLAVWFTVRQTRNIVVPVERLAQRARAIESQDFETRLDLEREDELGELAGAFDRMAQRLGRQFASLTTLAEMDRLILSGAQTAEVIRVVLERLRSATSADFVTLTLFEEDNPNQARTYFSPPEAPGSFSMDRHAVAAEDRVLLGHALAKRWHVLADEDSLPAWLEKARDAGMGGVYVEPILWRESACGALVFGYRHGSGVSDEDRRQAQELADRVAVAVSSAQRDEQLYMQAHFDPLTGLPNRLLFKDRVDREIARSERLKMGFAILVVDLDHFKTVNDSFGHTMGDNVLREAARRVSGCIRATDTVSRFGGDEFAVMLTALNHPQEAFLLAETIVAALSREFTLGGEHCFLSASAGISAYPGDGTTAEELLKSADTAMYRAKASGRAQVVYFEPRMNEEALARVTLDRDVRAAFDRGELVMHYQPQVDIKTGAIRGAEALIRWQHPTEGMIGPLRFIRHAEESGFIESLGQWTLRETCRQIRAWRDQGIEIERIAVNVSPRQFRRRLVENITACVAEAGIAPQWLEIEITEGLLLDASESVEGMLRELSAMGHDIALDDFGTGFSSMAYLKRYPVSTIKIDRVFIEGLGRSADSEAIVAAMIAMSHALGKTVVAEGVETSAQLALLRAFGCDEFQGFLFSPAVPAARFAELARVPAETTAE